MSGWKARLWGKSSKELRPGERALPFHPAPVIIVAIGALMVLVSMFMPAISSADYATVADNSVIQLSPTLLLCSLAATIASVRYWRVGSSGSANLAILAGFWFFLWAIIEAQNLSVTGPSHYVGGSFDDDGNFSPGILLNSTNAADAGVGLWAAGLGSLLVMYGGLIMRFPHLGFGMMAAPAASSQPQSSESPTAAAKNLSVDSKALGNTMTNTTQRIINDSTFVSSLPYARLFEITKQAGISLGGKLKVDDVGTGSLRFGFRWGINPTGLKVNIQLKRLPGGDAEISAAGGAWDFGVGAARGRAILFEIARQIEATTTTDGTAPQRQDHSEPTTSGTGYLSGIPSTANQPGMAYRGKSKTGAIIFCLIAGGLGIHRFYLGTWGFGVLFIGLTLVGSAIGLPYLGATLAICDAIRLLVMKKSDFEVAYNFSQVGPFTL